MAVTLPGLGVELVSPPADPEPLRTDVAGFIGPTRRGPIGEAVRVDGLTDCQRIFGGLQPDSSMTHALRGYFENGGRVAWVVRVAGRCQAASADWSVADLAGLPVSAYRIQAATPGRWGNATSVTVNYRRDGLTGRAEVDVRVVAPGEHVEVFANIPGEALDVRLQASLLIRLVALAEQTPPGSGPRWARRELALTGGDEEPARAPEYLQAVHAISTEPEVAIVVAPDLNRDLTGRDRDEVLEALMDGAANQIDRLALLDVPPELSGAEQVAAWTAGLRRGGPSRARATAVYYPHLRVPDPLGGAADPLRSLPPSGHVAGLISRLDRERGAHHTPANAVVVDAVDLEVHSDAEVALLLGAGVNPIRCIPGRGLQVWGGRTLDPAESGRFIAHRRLIHRLVRAIRRVAEPLVFDVSGPELRLTLVRGATSVLLEAFRAGALRGSRPQEAFVVRCDETNNPPGQDPGLVVCDIDVAPAVPMEFIKLRMLLGQEGRLEVVEV